MTGAADSERSALEIDSELKADAARLTPVGASRVWVAKPVPSRFAI